MDMIKSVDLIKDLKRAVDCGGVHCPNCPLNVQHKGDALCVVLFNMRDDLIKKEQEVEEEKRKRIEEEERLRKEQERLKLERERKEFLGKYSPENNSTEGFIYLLKNFYDIDCSHLSCDECPLNADGEDGDTLCTTLCDMKSIIEEAEEE